jgi:hypothetical protein
MDLLDYHTNFVNIGVVVNDSLFFFLNIQDELPCSNIFDLRSDSAVEPSGGVSAVPIVATINSIVSAIERYWTTRDETIANSSTAHSRSWIIGKGSEIDFIGAKAFYCSVREYGNNDGVLCESSSVSGLGQRTNRHAYHHASAIYNKTSRTDSY